MSPLSRRAPLSSGAIRPFSRHRLRDLLEGDGSRCAVVGHDAVLKEISTNKCEVLLPPCVQVNAGKTSIQYVIQSWKINLSEMNAQFAFSVSTCHILQVDNRELQRGSESGVDTTREGARIHQSGPSIPGKAGRGVSIGSVVWVEAYLNMQSRTELHQQFPPECSRLILEPTINHWPREPVDTERRPAASVALARFA